MKKFAFIGLLLLFAMSIVVACNQKEASPKMNLNQSLNLHFSKPDGQSYTVYKKIDDNETVKTVMSILPNVSWENGMVSMSRQSDYRIAAINTDPTTSYEPVTFDIWISPIKDILEVVSQSKYGKMTKEDSIKLLSILETP